MTAPAAAAAPAGRTPRNARGPADAPVTVELFGNYECLHCRRAWPEVEALLAEVGDGVRLVYHHFARPGDFPHAEQAAEAAEAAAAQGRFWEMHALLMVEAPTLHAEVLHASAAALGLDVARVREALATHAHRDVVRADVAEGLARGVTRTPTFHVNGVAVPPAADLGPVRVAVEEALAAVR